MGSAIRDQCVAPPFAMPQCGGKKAGGTGIAMPPSSAAMVNKIWIPRRLCDEPWQRQRQWGVGPYIRLSIKSGADELPFSLQPEPHHHEVEPYALPKRRIGYVDDRIVGAAQMASDRAAADPEARRDVFERAAI